MIAVVIDADPAEIGPLLPEDARVRRNGRFVRVRRGAEMVAVFHVATRGNGNHVYLGQGTRRALVALAGLGARIKRISDLTQAERDWIVANSDGQPQMSEGQQVGFRPFVEIVQIDGVDHFRLPHVLAGGSPYLEIG